MNPDLVASIVTALVSLILGVLSFIGASRARTRETEHDREPAPPDAAERDAYERAAGLLQDALARCEEETRILREQLRDGAVRPADQREE